MEQEPLLSVFMPARNEEPTILQNMRILQEGLRKGKINHAVMVIDGSTDKTREIIIREVGLSKEQAKKLTSKKRGTIVLQNGFIIINHMEPQGKGRNFMEAVFTLKGRTPHFKNPKSVLVNIDADALDLEVRKITMIAKEIAQRGKPMVLGTHIERGHDSRGAETAHQNATGFRAIKASALEPMLKKESSWIRGFPGRFGMDAALNYLIYPRTRGKHVDYSKEIPRSLVELGHSPPGKHESDSAQVRQRSDVLKRITRDPMPLNEPGHKSLAFKEVSANRELKSKRKRIK